MYYGDYSLDALEKLVGTLSQRIEDLDLSMQRLHEETTTVSEKLAEALDALEQRRAEEG